MAKYAECDVCGAKDDCNAGKGPFLFDGAELHFRDDSSQELPFEILEICPTCKKHLLSIWPELAKALEKK